MLNVVPIRFGRWLLRFAEIAWDDDALCWLYDGKFYNTDELYEVFLIFDKLGDVDNPVLNKTPNHVADSSPEAP